LFSPHTLAQTENPQPPTSERPAEFARVLTDYETAYPKGGVALAPLFTEDGFVMAGGRPPVRGRTAIADHYGPGRGQPLALRAFAFAVSGDVGYILGGYAMRRGDPDGGKFTLVLRKAGDGRWLIASDMDNTNRSPRPPQ
jgi:ketosteroid isomerase-like protein